MSPEMSVPRRPEKKGSIKNFFTTLAVSLSLLLNPTSTKAMEEIDGLSPENLMALIDQAGISIKGYFSGPIDIVVTDTNKDVFSGHKVGDKVKCRAEVNTDKEGHVNVNITYIDEEGEEIIISNK